MLIHHSTPTQMQTGSIADKTCDIQPLTQSKFAAIRQPHTYEPYGTNHNNSASCLQGCCNFCCRRGRRLSRPCPCPGGTVHGYGIHRFRNGGGSRPAPSPCRPRSRGQTVVGPFRERCSHSWAYLWRTGAGSAGAVLRCAARFGFRPCGLCGRRGVFLAASVDSRKRIDMLGRPVGTGGTALSHRQGPAPPAIMSNACSEVRGRRLPLKPIKRFLRLCVQV